MEYDLLSVDLRPLPEDVTAGSEPAYKVGTELSSVDNSSGNYSDAYSYYEYDYDYDASVTNLPLGEVIPVGIVYGLTLLLGVVGNR